MTEQEIRSMISVERANEIRESIMKTHGWDHDATEEENAALRQYWGTCPGNWSFFTMISHLCEESR